MVEGAENGDEPLSGCFAFGSSFFVEVLNTKGLIPLKGLEHDEVVGVKNPMDLILGVGGLACEFEAQGGELLGVHKKLGLEGHILSPAKQDRLESGAGLGG